MLNFLYICSPSPGNVFQSHFQSERIFKAFLSWFRVRTQPHTACPIKMFLTTSEGKLMSSQLYKYAQKYIFLEWLLSWFESEVLFLRTMNFLSSIVSILFHLSHPNIQISMERPWGPISAHQDLIKYFKRVKWLNPKTNVSNFLLHITTYKAYNLTVFWKRSDLTTSWWK